MDSFKLFFALGALFAFFAVAAGAFGAHALKHRFSVEQLAVFEVGVRYQMYHALALLAAAIWISIAPHSLVSIAAWLFVAGIIVFSGSLYLLALTSVKSWGAVTPIGGLLLLAGWGSLMIGALK